MVYAVMSTVEIVAWITAEKGRHSAEGRGMQDRKF